MRNVMLSLLFAAAGAIGLAAPTTAEARHSDRIFVGIGDVTFSYGRPYYRYDHSPLYVVYERGYPRYYRIVEPRYYAPPPRHVYAPPHDWRHHDRYRYRDWRDDRHDHRRHGDRYWD